MKIPRFPLSSDQLELLLAFEQSEKLTDLAQRMGRDTSVISRQLQKMVEQFPVLSKVRGKWVINSLGLRVNEVTLKWISEFDKVIDVPSKKTLSFQSSALIIINAQKGLLESKLPSNNPHAQRNIKKLMNYWRANQGTLIHVQHVSENTDSLFYKESSSVEFLQELEPLQNEIVLQKKKSSCFTDTNLQEILEQKQISKLMLVGFTANECIQATAKDAFEKGMNAMVLSDATAMFDLVGEDHRIYKAEEAHGLLMANINALYAKVAKTEFVLNLH